MTPQPILLMRVGRFTHPYTDELLEDAGYTPEQIAAMHNIARAEPGVSFKAPWALSDEECVRQGLVRWLVRRWA